MGAFYGSVQVRSENRDAVRSALEKLSRKKKRFLLGPPLNGWVGIYPEGSGQDFRIARDLARRLPGEIVATLVHDDDVFAYEYYRDGKRIDQYNSEPDYFGEVSEKKKHDLRGRPEAFAHLATDLVKFEALVNQLANQADDRAVFASALLEEFAGALGIHNALTSYEDLKEHEETDDIEGWDQFIHVPDLSHEQGQQRAADAAILEQKQHLIREGRLLAERGGLPGWASPSPWWCPSPDGRGFLVAWSSHADPNETPLPLEYHGPPWTAGPAATPWTIGPHVYGMELSPSGRYLAVAHAAGDWKAALWDLGENRLIADVPQVHAVSCVCFIPDESAMLSVSSDGEEGQVVITPIGAGNARVIPLGHAKLAAVHPSGSWLVVADSFNRLRVVDIASDGAEQIRLVSGRSEEVFRIRFDPKGERLCLATTGGVRVYSWHDILKADGDLPRPALAVDLAGILLDLKHGSLLRGGFIYDFDHDPDRDRLLFAGLDGHIHFLDLVSGRSGVLLEPPAHPPVHRLALSRDRTTLALTSHPDMFARGRNKRGPLLQFWDYQAIGQA